MYTILFILSFLVFCFALFALGFSLGIKYSQTTGYTPKQDDIEIKPPNGGTGVIWYSLKNNEK